MNSDQALEQARAAKAGLLIRYYTRRNYGTDHHYPLDHGSAVSRLTGRATMTNNDINALRDLGFTLAEVVEPK